MRVLLVASFLVIVLIISPGAAYRILGIFSYNGRSHFMMYGALMKGLAERGHQVDVVSHYPPKKPLPNYNQIVNLAGILPTAQNNLTYEDVLASEDVPPAIFTVTTCGGDLCDLMDQPAFKQLINNPPQDPPYDLLIVDVMGATCYLALGQHLKVPIVGTVSSALWPWVNDMVANPDNPAYIASVFSGFVERMNFWERVLNTVGLLRDKWDFFYHGSYQDEKIKKYIGPHAPSLREAEKNISLILVNSHYSLHGVRPYTTAVVEVGGLHVSENVGSLPEDLEKWLDDSEDGFVYISFGSMVKIESFPKPTLHVLYAALAKLAPVRVLMKIANPKELPPGLSANVLTNPWIPQLAVLKHKHIRAFMTHGGLMGTQEAVYFGVPMIGVPLFADQTQNIKIYMQKHVAVSLDHEELTEEKLDAAFNTVLNDPSYMKAAKKLSAEFRDRPMSAMDTAVFWVEYVIRHGGANLRSPAMDLTWWQIALLDVYGALVFATVFAMYLLRLITVKLIAFFTRSRVDRVVNSKKFK